MSSQKSAAIAEKCERTLPAHPMSSQKSAAIADKCERTVGVAGRA